MKRNILIVGALLIVAALALFGSRFISQSEEASKNLVIYSGRKDSLILPIVEAFEKETGIKTTIRSGSTQELANLILKEGDNTEADIYIGTDASFLEKINRAGLFTEITSDELAKIPAAYQARDKKWTGVSGRSRVLLVNTDLVPEDQYPTSISDITNPTWQDKVAMASLGNESVITHLSALRTIHDDEYVLNFLKGIKNNNVKILNGHTDVRQAVGRGEYAIGLTNHYYGHLQQKETGNIAIVYTDQSEDEDGTMVNVSGVGILASSKNEENAQKFVEYLLTDGQKLFAELNFEYPLREGVQPTNAKKLGEFKQMKISLHEVAEKVDSTINLIKEAGF